MKSRIPLGAIQMRSNDAPTLQGRLAAALVRAVLEGKAVPGTRLPSSRGLATALGISRMTVTLVYQDLISQGYLETLPRSGVVVAASVPHRRLTVRDRQPDHSSVDWDHWLAHAQPRQRVVRKPADWRDYRYPFIYGQADPTLFDHNAWRDCARRSWGARDFAELAADQYGMDDALLIDYICSNSLPRRGIHARPDEVLVTMGAQNALFLAVELLGGPDRLAVTEDPGYPDFAEALRRTRTPTTFLPLRDGSLDPSELPEGTRLVIVTPSHNIPTGATMPLPYRYALLDRAAADDFLIIEDDYDFEMSYLAPPAPALKSLDRYGRVIYMGSFSKALFPGLRIGYMVAPAPLIARARDLRAIMLRHPPGHLQRITAYFLALGHYDAHITRLRQTLKRRRAVLEEALHGTSLRVAGAAATGGSCLWIEARSGIDSQILADRLQSDRVLIEPGAVFFETPPDPCPFFRLGYSSISERDIPQGIALIDRAAR